MRKNIFIYLAMVLVLSSCNNGKKTLTKQPQVVKVSKVIQSQDAITREFPFISKAYQQSELSFRVGGPLTHFNLQAGDYFKKGQLIATIDQRDYLINKEAKEARYIQAKAEYQRVKTLYNKKNVSAKIFDNAKANYRLTKAEYEAAVNALKDTRLIAPFNGYIQDIMTEEHQVVRANQIVLSFINIEQLKIESYIPEEISFNASTIESIQVSFDALQGKEIPASSWEISKSATSNNISFLMTAIIDNHHKESKLLGGMTGTIRFTQSQDKSHSPLIIPQVAVCHRPSIGSYVWLYNPTTKKIQMNPIQLGSLKQGALVEVTKGLQREDLIVTTGQNYLSNQMTVTIAKS